MSPLAFSSDTGKKLTASGLHVVVTGGGGWLGRATLEMLESCFGARTASLVHVFASSRRSIELRSGTRLDAFPLADLPRLAPEPHLLAHYAFATRELVSEMGADNYIARNQEITDRIATYVGESQPQGVLALSSGAVYLGDEIETNPYGVLKARAERRILETLSAMGEGTVAPRLVIPRLFNLAGPFLNKPDRYVLGSIIRDIRQGGPIRLVASRPVVRSYVHVRDLVELAFAIMVDQGPPPSSAFDTAGEREVEVGELARLAASVLGAAEMEIVRPPLEDDRPDRYVGDPSILNALASRYGLAMKTLPQQIVDTALAMEL